MDQPARVLFVCTGNICRSPIAAGLLRARAAGHGVAVDVASCGLSVADRPATDEAVQAARARGADIGGHRSARLARDAVAEADLVIGMERHHVREALLCSPGALGKTYTFKDLVRRAERVGPRAPDESFAAWIERVGAGRRADDIIGFDAADEVADPYARSMAAYDLCADEISGLVDRLLELAWPATETEGAA